MERVIRTTEYGLCVFSLEMMKGFLKKEKIRSKKLLALFQKDKKKYIGLIKEGIWVPFPGIDSTRYDIRIKNLGENFDDEWEEVLEYGGFNIETKGGVWVSSIGSFLEFDENCFQGEGREYRDKYNFLSYDSAKERWYKTYDGNVLYTDFWYDIPDGKYLLNVKGYAKKTFDEGLVANCGFQYEFIKVDQFTDCKNPREDTYDFNVGGIVRARKK